MIWIATYEILYLDDLPSRAIAVWLYLSRRANKDNQCWPAIDRIAQELHLSGRTVQRALRDLEHSGWITVEPRCRGNGSTTSHLITLRSR